MNKIKRLHRVLGQTFGTVLTAALVCFSSGCNVQTGVLGSAGLSESGRFSGIGAVTVLSPSSVRVTWDVSPSYSSYQVFSSSSPLPIGTTFFSNLPVSGLTPDTDYSFSVGGISQNQSTLVGISRTISIHTWPTFTGISSLIATSPTTLQASWSFPVSGPTFRVYIKAGSPFAENDPVLQTPAVSTTVNTVAIAQLANGSPIMPNTTYYVLVRATYLDNTSEYNGNVLTVKTPSNISPLPKVTSDPIILGKWPTFTVSGGLSTYATTFKRGSQTLGSLTGNGSYQIPSALAVSPGLNTLSAILNYNGSAVELPDLQVRARTFVDEIIEFPELYEGKGFQRFGATMTTGDYNCDGFMDLASSAPFGNFQPFISQGIKDGAVYVYFGSSQGLITTPEPSVSPADTKNPLLILRPKISTGNLTDNWFGWSLASGNLNADQANGNQCDDLAIGTHIYGTPTAVGEAWVFFGSSMGLQLGTPVLNSPACSGGICAPLLLYPLNGVPPGGSFSGGLPRFGQALTIGRLHKPVGGDQYRDLIISGPSDTSTGGAGAIWIYYGGAEGIKLTSNANGSVYPFTKISGPAETFDTYGFWGNFGMAIAAVDLDADGIDDIAVGAPTFTTAVRARGKLYYYSSLSNNVATSGVFPPTATVTQSITNPTWPEFHYAEFAGHLANAGDLNGDGKADLVVGSGLIDWWGGNPTDIHIIYGGTGGPHLGSCKSNRTTVGTGSTCTPNQTASCDPATNVCSIMNLAFNNSNLVTNLGVAVAGANPRGGQDVDGDGLSDIAVGFPINGANLSEARIYYGSTSGIRTNASKLKPLTSGPYDNVGYAVTLGNFDGNEWSDVAVSAPDNRNINGLFGGVVYTYHGQAGGLPGVATNYNKLLMPNASKESYRDSFALPVGDINNDGYTDAIMRLVRARNPGAGFWGYFDYELILYFGSASGLITTPAPSLTPAQPTDPTLLPPTSANSFAVSYFPGAAGDVNGDGYNDIAIFSPDFQSLYLYYGSSSGLQTSILPAAPPTTGLDPVIVSISNNVFAVGNYFNHAGTAITSADFNGDGFDDLAVAADGMTTKGVVVIIYGSGSGIQTDGILEKPAPYGAGNNVVYTAPCTGTIPNLTCKAQWLLSLTDNEKFGRQVAAAGDVNGDGYEDLLVGVHGNDIAGTDNGGAYLFYGGPQGLETWGATASGVLIVPGLITAQTGRVAGIATAAAGDVNNDGFSDILINSIVDNASWAGSGGAFLFYGCGNGLHNSAVTPGCPPTGIWGVNTSAVVVPKTEMAINTSDSCNGNVCRPLFFVPQGVSSAVPSCSSYNWGRLIGGPGDLNDDGYEDVVIGAYGTNNPCTSAMCLSGTLNNGGAAVIYTGSANGLNAGQNVSRVPSCVGGVCSPYWIQPSIDDWGVSKASFNFFTQFTYMNRARPSDFNGDGLPDILFNSANFTNRTNTSAFTGGFYVFQ